MNGRAAAQCLANPHRESQMTSNMAARTVSLAAVLTLALIAACSDAVTPAPVVPKPVAAVLVTPPLPSVIVGEQVTLQAQPKSADNELLDRPVTWSSENAAIATVTDGGLVSTLAVGEVGIRATSEGKYGRAVLVVLPVPPVPVATVRLSANDVIELEWNGSAQISAVALDANGNELPDRAVLWATNKPGVATVTNGAIQAIASGTATITASIEGVTSQIGVRVKTAPVTEVLLEVGVAGLEVGETVLFGARLKTASGQILVGPVTWESSAPAVARVTATDLALGAVEVLSAGDVTITASAEGKSASVALRSTPRPTHDLIYNRYSGTATEIFILGLGANAGAPLRLNAGNVSRDPSPSPDGTQFVFAVSQLDLMGRQQHDLFIVNRNGMNMRWLTRVEGHEDQPQWSPNGGKILFHGTDGDYRFPNLFVINVDGTGLTNLTAALPADVTDKREPAWSPDGSKIAFIAARAGQHKVWTMNADGSNAAPLTTDAGFDVTPTWSPNGDRIAFVRFNNTTPANGDDI